MGNKFDGSKWVADPQVKDLGNITGAVTLPDGFDLFRATLTGNVTFTLPTAKAGRKFAALLTQDGAGSRTVAATGAQAAGAALGAASTAAGAVDILKGECYDGTHWVLRYESKAVA